MPDTTKNICLIPARGGSKRIPKKNIVDFHGKPMLAYTIEAAQHSGLFGAHIYVSSDSEEILHVASSYGVKTVRRPAEFSGDTASLEEVTQHVLREVGQTTFENLCLLMPNCPLRTSEDVTASHARVIESGANCLMSVLRYEWLYPFWALQEQEGKLDFFFGKKYVVDSKLLPKDIYCPSGAIRWIKIANFLVENKFYGKDLTKYVLPFERGADIDTYEDLELAKKLYPLVYPSNI
ncbi:MAG: acylneuraminate cytidylyltransferase family protein [Candidatus Paceibacterota bacterium]|jgi:CMP-N-acetylneuraminic acid synthetase